jgi:hypothetical protein
MPARQSAGRPAFLELGVAGAGVDLVAASGSIGERAVPDDRCGAVVGLAVGVRPGSCRAAAAVTASRTGRKPE